MSKHTPGRWTYRDFQGGNTIYAEQLVAEKMTLTPIAEVHRRHECRADAALIAAAPALLEAARDAASSIRVLNSRRLTSDETLNAEADALKAAIDAATKSD